jgi:hypothetical protein
MESRGLFNLENEEEENYYFVVGVRADAWDANGKNHSIFFYSKMTAFFAFLQFSKKNLNLKSLSLIYRSQQISSRILTTYHSS